MSSMFDNPIFTDDNMAREHLESLRWPDGPVCPHCGCVGNSTRLQGAKHRPGVWKCNDCRKQYTVTVGTVFEKSKVPLRKWLLATHLMCASKKGMSAHQLHRMLGVTYKTAWFMAHRIREAMRDESLDVLGGAGEIVEADETYWGHPKAAAHAWHHKEKIVSLVERGGEVRSFHVDKVNKATLIPLMTSNIDAGSRIMTDEASYYDWCAKHFASRESVSHKAKEFSRGDVTTNTVEGFFSIVKRGLIGTYHHVDPKYLTRYLDEFDFRYNAREITDAERTKLALKGIAGKRLYYPC